MAKRTREHVIADIAQKHVELTAAKAGCSSLAVAQGSDYGIDLPVMTVGRNGELEPGYLLLQIKASERLDLLKGDDAVTVRVSRANVLHWLDHPMPVILVRYDVATSKAYWLYVQRHFEKWVAFDRNALPENVTLRVPALQVMTVETFLVFAEYKRAIMLQISKVIRHA